MGSFFDLLRTRLIPASLTAAGIALITAGLLSYTAPVETAEVDETPMIIEASHTPAPSSAASASPIGSVPPSIAPSPTPSIFPKGRVATRVVIPGLRIDLPIVKPGSPGAYPLCDVAQYLKADGLGQPGQGRATYIYGHAREGMFLPLLEASQESDHGASMLGLLVQVFTSDDQLFLYEIHQVRPHQLTINDAIRAKSEQLWLQTSEGPKGTKPKLQVVASFVTSGPTRHADAHPTPHPVVCG
jgi:hypothetical protein